MCRVGFLKGSVLIRHVDFGIEEGKVSQVFLSPFTGERKNGGVIKKENLIDRSIQ